MALLPTPPATADPTLTVRPHVTGGARRRGGRRGVLWAREVGQEGYRGHGAAARRLPRASVSLQGVKRCAECDGNAAGFPCDRDVRAAFREDAGCPAWPACAAASVDHRVSKGGESPERLWSPGGSGNGGARRPLTAAGAWLHSQIRVR